ncbi:hypothetical protein P170DRAFT_346896 [Aspergillus steynii IBT 23096]|uniref:Nephrocystin 3-like N-terminal domain-containing protein n=1 Tax=Aspergillus steynii IBT 23096 TaxID=1392250 RepID=A0A2I2GM69_9EURO|nr:uncharacterized protein P170DRAFT_346896 [Aspergillus steynii IBT 23096]PLB53965.1 hypothetical protein P170DRAFT_346896 [Aspergillus steynii IBT 23096]
MGMELAFKMTDLIPSEYGLSVIKGVLGIAFEVMIEYPKNRLTPSQTAKKRQENRNKILEAFESIPGSILSINLACGLLKPTEADEKLRQDFHVTLLNRMPELVDILLGKPAWYVRVRSHMTFKIRETMKVDEILSEWNNYIATLKERVSRMRDRLWSEVAYHSAEAHQLGTQANTKLDKFSNRFDEIQSIIVALGPAIVAAMKTEFGNEFRKMERAIQANELGAKAQTLLLYGFEELEYANNQTVNASYYSHASSSQGDTQPPQIEPCTLITQLELLGLLRVSPSSALADLDFILQQASRYPEWSLRQIWWLTKMDEFVNWYHGPQSSLLLADGFLDCASSDTITPMSILDASFILNLRRNASRIVLSFFADLYDSHDAQEDPNVTGPSGLIRSLIAQLLSHESLPDPDLGFLTHEWIEACRDDDLKALCELFKQLVLQVPPGMQVFCVLDGLVIYEDHHTWGRQIDYVAALFEHIVRSTRHPDTPGFKALFTFANRSLQISDRVDRSLDVWGHAPLTAHHMDGMPLMI